MAPSKTITTSTSTSTPNTNVHHPQAHQNHRRRRRLEEQQQHKQHDHSHHHQSLVIFAGPHKSASSSVQEFFMKYASNVGPISNRHQSLYNWTWPYNVRRRSYLPRKGFAPLVTEYNDPGFVKLIYDTILYDVWNNQTASPGLNNHIILGTEEFDRFGTTPWSHRNGIKAMKGVVELLNVHNNDNDDEDTTSVVVNYRRPRHDQWISIWKQLTRSNNQEYNDFLCDPDEYLRLWEYLDSVANPLGLVKALLLEGHDNNENEQERKRYWNVVHLMDMQGISNAGLDVAHVVACEVLWDVDCRDSHGWLPGLEPKHATEKSVIIQNKKSGDPKLSPSQLDDMEWLLRQRDCTYMDYLKKQQSLGYFKIHHEDNIWQGCPEETDTMTSTLDVLSNTTFLLELLQSQVGCGPYSAIKDDGRSDQTSIISKLQQQPQLQTRQPQSLGNVPTATSQQQQTQEAQKATTRTTIKEPSKKDDGDSSSNKKQNVVMPSPLDRFAEASTSSSPVKHGSSSTNSATSTTTTQQQQQQQHDLLLQSAKIQLYILYILLLVVFVTLYRRVKWKRLVQKNKKKKSMTVTRI